MKLCHAMVASVLLATGVSSAYAASPSAQGWAPQSYSLGTTQLFPVVISNRIDTDEEAVTVRGERAPVSELMGAVYGSPQSVFNIGRDPLMKPANCQEQYTTVAGQPGAGPDLSTAVGIRGCYF